MKYILFLFLPFCLLFFQAERGRMENSHHKSGYTSDQSDVSSDSDDDSVTVASCDDDEDDATETISRIAPTATCITFSSTHFQYEFPVTISLSQQISYRDVSPSFLRVFRI